MIFEPIECFSFSQHIYKIIENVNEKIFLQQKATNTHKKNYAVKLWAHQKSGNHVMFDNIKCH